MAESQPEEVYCYCCSSRRDVCMIQCDGCKRLFHIGCLKNGKPSIFEGDMFFSMVCVDCSSTGEEDVSRMKLQWLPVVMLGLYNLQMTCSGNRGYFRWKEQICSYIDKNWMQFFGHSRKKTTTWHGTVAGVLSSGCPQYFQSGTQELRESGWWRLAECKPPPLEVLSSGKSGSRKQRMELAREQTSPLKLEGLRSRAGKTSIQAAMELRAKRDSLSDPREAKRSKLSAPGQPVTPKSATTSPVRSYCSDRLSLESASTSFKDDSASRDELQLPSSVECTPMRSNSSFDLASDLADQSSQMSFSSTKSDHWFSARDLVANEKLPECLLKDEEEEECDSDLEIDPCALSPDSSVLTSPGSIHKISADPLPQMEDILAALESKGRDGNRETLDTSFQAPELASDKTPTFIQPTSKHTVPLFSQPIQSFTFIQPSQSPAIKQEPLSEDSNTTEGFGNIKHEPVSEDSNTYDSSLYSSHHGGGSVYDSMPTPQMLVQNFATPAPTPSDITPTLSILSDTRDTTGTFTPPIMAVPSTPSDDIALPSTHSDFVNKPLRELHANEVNEKLGTYPGVLIKEENIDAKLDLGEAGDSRYQSGDEAENTPEEVKRTKLRKVDLEKAEMLRREEEQQRLKHRCIALSVYEECQMLKSITAATVKEQQMPSNLKRLRRKLAVRQIKRERGLPLFDIDSYMNKLHGHDTLDPDRHHQNEDRSQTTSIFQNNMTSPGSRILDRFQSCHQVYYQKQSVSFLNRLVGTEDDQLQCIKSPYTTRLLKPFIRRDFDSRPRKLRLLMEIKAYPHRNDPQYKPPPPASIDYCYVRPQHIPSVNTLCREFFWPGIDLSECLQYPDFSCVVLYRKFVIGFAFMVPDVKYNEAYISFIFTHPEWRGAGIGSFMLYHLIQTCMGKDVTLHVSASNPAMMLYQKFGFKTEEMILNFYEKYFPIDAKDSRHAFFLRLHR